MPPLPQGIEPCPVNTQVQAQGDPAIVSVGRDLGSAQPLTCPSGECAAQAKVAGPDAGVPFRGISHHRLRPAFRRADAVD